MINGKADNVIEFFLNHFLIVIKLDWKHQGDLMMLSLIVFINVIKNF